MDWLARISEGGAGPGATRRWLGGLLLLAFLFPAAAVSAEETLTIPGTGDSQILLRKLVVAYGKTHHQGGEIVIPESIGSSGGIKAVARGQAPMARVARPLKDKEQVSGLHYREFAASPIAFVANLPKPCLEGVTGRQLLGIFAGKINNWSELGACPDHKIYVVNREAGDSSRLVLERHLPGFRELAQPVGETLFSTPETLETILRSPYAVGYLPLAAVKDSSLRVLAVDGQGPSAVNLAPNNYPFFVPFALVWRGEPSGLARRFQEYLWSPAAAALMVAEGVRPSTSPP